MMKSSLKCYVSQDTKDVQDGEDDDDDDIPCDTMAALILLRGEFQITESIQELVWPIMLKSQLYTIVKDRTTVDREVISISHRIRFWESLTNCWSGRVMC